ncbi:P pilus assembly protein, pilin FimA [Serratia fonticola]|uniref:P pilus assembly protein, pilin FimA n=1 Tax=Serratia fonticola TaxID=47917 RepID=A0A4U9TQV9_SERFO|nr:P pilus assembly protein, pilin FimA [Serratia fonticola]
MTHETGRYRQGPHGATELKYYATLAGLALMVPLTLGMMMWLLPGAQAKADNWDIEGANGSLYVYGALTESACRLDMTSAHQDVALGEVGTGRLQTIGARGEPVRVELRLADCLRSPAGSIDVRTGRLTWADNQPAVTVSFNAPRDADNPQLLKARGVSGPRVAHGECAGRRRAPGQPGQAAAADAGQNTLSYHRDPGTHPRPP